MNFKNLLPVTLFCVIFLAYTLYFVKVVSAPTRLPPNAIGHTVRQYLEEQKEQQEELMVIKNLPSKEVENPEPVPTSLGVKYVNYTWLNVRSSPSLFSPVLEKIYLNDEVTILENPTSSWTFVMIPSGAKGYVASKYLSETKTEVKSPTAQEPVVVLEQTIFKIPVISYHHISDSEKYAPNLNLPVVNFLAQLEYLAGSGIETLTFFDLKAIAEGKKLAPQKSVILTFDDGYDDAYQVAQHLNGKGMRGVFFIITDQIGKPGYLDWRQVKKMRSWGMEIGSHGVKSGDLIASTDFFIKDELERSKKLIEEQLGEEIISFSYPAGRYNDKIIDFTRKAGYFFARTIVSGSQYKSTQFMRLPTLRVFSPAGAKQFKAWLSSD